MSESLAFLTHPNNHYELNSMSACLLLCSKWFHASYCNAQLSHLQGLPLQPDLEARPDCLLELLARIIACCAACTNHQADSTNACLTGTLPGSWGGNGSFAALVVLEIGCGSNLPDGITGSMPSEWGSSEAFQLLQTLIIDTCSIAGEHGFLANVDAPPDWPCC